MKILINRSILALGMFAMASVAGAKDKKWSGYQELATTVAAGEAEGDDLDFSGYLYNSVSYKVSADNSLSAELFSPLQYTGGFDINHAWLRLFYNRKNAFKFGDWKTALRIRWIAPTSEALQRAGGLGIIAVRPEIKREWGNFTLTLRDTFGIHMVDQSFQKYTSKSDNVRNPNKLVINAITAIPEFNIAKGLDTWLETNFVTTYSGKAPGKAANTSNMLSYELVFAYDIKPYVAGILDLVMLATYHESGIGDGADFKLVSRAQNYSFKIAKDF